MAALQANLTCADLPRNWGDDESSDDSQNGPWEDLSGTVSQSILDAVYSTFQERQQEGQYPPISGWSACDTTPTSSAVGCQQVRGASFGARLDVQG